MDFNLNLGCIDEGNLSEISCDKLYDVLVVGTGPSAVSAAIYAARKGLDVAMIGLKIGGQVLDTREIENIIGTAKTTGSEYAENLEKHLKEYCVAFKEGTYVTKIEEDGKNKLITTSDKKIYKSKTVIIATGAKWRELNVPGEQEYKGKGVHYCATCDGPFYKGLDVAVVGGGNSGIEAALDMAGIAKNVTVVEFMPELKADKILQDKLNERNNFKVITNAATTKIYGEDFTKGMEYQNRADESTHELNIDGVFIEIGLTPNSEFAKDLIATNKIGEIIIDENNMTNIKGIFASGDVTTVKQKQIVISVGEGAKAALGAFDYLLKEY